MNVRRRFTLLGVLLVVLSVTMATQYATTKISYSFGIVHPSDADIRFIASDNSAADNKRVLRAENNATNPTLTIELGDWMPNSEKNYTSALGIVNEEQFAVTISHCTISGTGSTNVSVWVHEDRDVDVSTEASANKFCLVSDGVSQTSSGDTAWVLAAGDGDSSSMNGGGIATDWDSTSQVRYTTDDTNADNSTTDFVWVQISLNIPSNAPLTASATGTIEFHFRAAT